MLDVKDMTPQQRLDFDRRMRWSKRQKRASQLTIHDFRIFNALPICEFNSIPDDDDFRASICATYQAKSAFKSSIRIVLISKQAFDDFVAKYPTCRDEDCIETFHVVDATEPYAFYGDAEAPVFYPIGMIGYFNLHRVFADFMLDSSEQFVKSYMSVVDISRLVPDQTN